MHMRTINRMRRSSAAWLALLGAAHSTSNGIERQSACPTVLAPTYSAPTVSSGWTAQLVVSGLSKPRSLLFDSSGALLVLDSGVGIKRLTLTDDGGSCLVADTPALLVNLTMLNHGLALSNDGKTLYASDADVVLSWSYDPASGKVTSDSSTIVSGMANNDQVTRTILMSQAKPGMLLVSRGSDENQESILQSSGLGQIKAFNLSALSPSSQQPYDFDSDGQLLGWGLYNAVGLAEHPQSGGIFSMDSGADDITRDGVDVHENNPGDEMNFHGFLNGSTTDQGGNYGYPVCYAAWNLSIPDAPAGLQVGEQFSIMDNATLNDTTCQTDYVAPRLTFAPHQSPLDLVFTPDGTSAYVSFHGSTDKNNPVGYLVGQVAFDAVTGQPTADSDSTTALVDMIRNTDDSTCPTSCMRPVGMAIDSQGRLFFASDATGEIYVLVKSMAGANGTMVLPADEGKSAGNRMAAGIVGVVIVVLVQIWL